MHQMRRRGLQATYALCFLLAPIAAFGEDAAKPAEPAAPAADAAKPVEPPKPVEAVKPPETPKPAETTAAPAAPPTPAGSPTAAGSAWNAQVAPTQSGAGLTLDAHQTDIVNKVSSYFSDLNTLQGSFVQTSADDKRMKGKFYVKRPGRFRFDYARPSRQIVISDGRYLAIQDLDLNNEDRVALDQTPFRLLLRSDVNLVRDARIMEVQESEDMLVVALEDKDPESPGEIKLFLATKPSLELKEWVTRDAQGLKTRVEVSDLAKSVELDANLFQIKPIGRPVGSP